MPLPQFKVYLKLILDASPYCKSGNSLAFDKPYRDKEEKMMGKWYR